MKIDKRKCPILFDQLSFRKLGLTKYAFSGGEIEDQIMWANETILNAGVSNIMFITHPVLAAFDYGSIETIEKLLSLRNEIQTVARTVIWHVENCMTTTIYSIEKQETRTTFSILCQQQFTKLHANFNYHVAGYWDHSNDNYLAYNAGGTSSRPIPEAKKIEFFSDQIQLIIQCEVFLQYAKLETKLLQTNNKESIACKYHNKLPFPLTIVDSTWYTTLVKSDAFKVRGHFRLQPFGPTLSNRKLIWIAEFQKSGYRKEAKKLSEVLI